MSILIEEEASFIKSGAAVTYSAWNPSDRSTIPPGTGEITLSNFDLTATATAGPANWFRNVRNDMPIIGKTEFGVTWNNVAGGVGAFLGISNDTYDINNNYLGNVGGPAYMFYTLTGQLFYNNLEIRAGSGGIPSGSPVQFLVDVPNLLLYIRTSGGLLYGGNPITETGGVDISSLSGENIMAYFGAQKNSDSGLLNNGDGGLPLGVTAGYKEGIFT